VLLAASWLLDIVYFIFAFAGLESLANLTKPGSVPTPYSHGLFMALVWTALAGLLAWRIYHSRRAGLVIGLVVFSHWILDFISWNNLNLFFQGSTQVGLGLFNALGSSTIYIELGLFLAGMAIYLIGRQRSWKSISRLPKNQSR
jgi:membrane-bound metal-dependent hydrolase YbcI (DUF457 family)